MEVEYPRLWYTPHMAEIKTMKTTASVSQFIASIKNEAQRDDAKKLVKLFESVTKKKATMWGSSIIGFDQYHYKSERSTQEGDWPMTGFSPRVQNMTIYIMLGFKEYGALLKKIGKHKTSSGCLYFKRLDDLHLPTLRTLIGASVKAMRKKYPKASSKKR